MRMRNYRRVRKFWINTERKELGFLEKILISYKKDSPIPKDKMESSRNKNKSL